MDETDEEYSDYRDYQRMVLEEIAKEPDSINPLKGVVGRIYFVSYSGGKGKKRKRPREVEMIDLGKRCQTVKDHSTGRLDSLAEELIPPDMFPDDITHLQHFLNLFRKLGPNKKTNGKKKGKKPRS